jgi:hypothetical protein
MVESFHSDWKGDGVGWFTIVHVNVARKVACILMLGKINAFLRLQNLEAKKIMQRS